MTRCDGAVGQEAGRQVDDRVGHVVDLVGAEGLRDVADGTGEGEDQRRHGEHGEERRLGRQTGHPVAHRGGDGRHDDPPRRLAELQHPRGPYEARPARAVRGPRRLGARHGVYGNHMSSRLRAATNQPPPLVGSQRGHGRSPRWSRRSPDTPGPPSSTTWSSSDSRPGPPRPGSTAGSPTGTSRSSRRTTASATGSTRSTFHPSWHWLMERAVGYGLQAAPWEQQAEGATTAHVRRAAGFMAWSHTDPAHGCPISMTYAAVPALRADPGTQPWRRSGSPPWRRRRTTPASGPSPRSAAPSPGWG